MEDTHLITKFKLIKNMAVFNDFKWDNSVVDVQGTVQQFKQVNIIYGRNYSGKTTLSRIVRAFETGSLSDKYIHPSFQLQVTDGTTLTQEDYSKKKLVTRVFNEDFVIENLRFITNPDEHIIPFAVLGKNNAKIETEIAKIEIRLGSKTENQETKKYAELKSAKKTYDEAKKALETAKNNLEKQKSEKAIDKKIGIKYKSDIFGNINYSIKNLTQDIKTVLEESYTRPTEEQLKIYETTLAEKKLDEPTVFHQIILSLSTFVNSVKELCERKIGTSKKIQELIHDAALNEWVHQGIPINEGRETCAFCGQNITVNRWEELYLHFDEESETLQSDIEIAKKKIEDEKKTIIEKFVPILSQFYGCYVDELNLLIKQYGEKCVIYTEKLDILLNLLEQRKNSIAIPIPFEKEIDLDDGFEAIISSYSNLRQRSIAYGKQIETEKQKAQVQLRLAEVDSFVTTIRYKEQIVNIGKLEGITFAANEAEKKIADSIKEDIQQIEKLRRLQNDEEKGAIAVNGYLQNFFGHRYISLIAKKSESDEGKKIFFEIERNGEKAYNLSEGERSLIAFCYFVAKLNDSETVDRKPIIWIDDPISSLDGNHIYFVFGLIQNMLLANGNFEQIFITTHNLLFLKYLRGLEKMNRSATNLLIERLGEKSTIKLMPKYLKDHGTEFNYWFSKIYSVATSNGITDKNHFLYEAFGNNVRKFFETYLYYRYPDNKTDKEHLRLLFQDEPIGRIIISKLYDEQSHAQGDLENHEVIFEEPEILEAARFIIKRLKEVDSSQFEALVASIS